MQDLAQQLHRIQERIRFAERKYGREQHSVSLLAVSKTRPASAIRSVYEMGIQDVAENYQQEAARKQEQLADCDINWHFIGPVQSNKCAYISEHFDWVHSLDRLKTAKRLGQRRPATKSALSVCLQVNISAEASKSGLAPDQLMELAQQLPDIDGIRLRGLMALPAPATEFKAQRASFSQVRALFDELCARGLDLDTLSMGTTNDMEAAIAEGATMVRIGTALFGPRNQQNTPQG